MGEHMSAAEVTCLHPLIPSTTRWDAADLRRRLSRALDAAHRAVLVLGPSGYNISEPNGVRPEKVLSETAIFLLGSQQACASDENLAQRHRSVAEALIPYARNERVAALIVLEPIVSLDHALVHLCLSKMGLRDERFDRLVAAAQTTRAATARERLPHRVMEQDWLAYLAGLPTNIRRLNVGQESILSRSLDPLCSSADDCYAFTHALMFGSMLGARRPMLPRTAAEIVADAEIALGHCLDQQDYDLGGELLLTWPLLARRWSAAATFGFMCLARVEDEAGFLPAPSISLEQLAKLQGEERSRYAMAMTYHTVYVMGLLCALSLRPGSAPPRDVPGTRRHRGAAAALATFPDSDREPKHWQGVFADLNEAQRDSLAPLLLSIQLRRAADRRDLARIQELLRVAVRFDLLASSAPQQALQLLQRSVLLHEQL